MGNYPLLNSIASIAMENDRFSIIQFVDLPLNKGDLSISMLVYQRVSIYESI